MRAETNHGSSSPQNSPASSDRRTAPAAARRPATIGGLTPLLRWAALLVQACGGQTDPRNAVANGPRQQPSPNDLRHHRTQPQHWTPSPAALPPGTQPELRGMQPSTTRRSPCRAPHRAGRADRLGLNSLQRSNRQVSLGEFVACSGRYRPEAGSPGSGGPAGPFDLAGLDKTKPPRRQRTVHHAPPQAPPPASPTRSPSRCPHQVLGRVRAGQQRCVRDRSRAFVSRL